MTRMRMFAILAVPLVLSAAMAPSTPVADAAMRGDLAAVRALVARGENVNAAQGDGMTALHWAAERGDLAMTEVLLKARASVTATTRNGAYTPLHLAARGGHGAIVAALLDAGADPNQFTATGVTALHLAAGAGSVEGIEALVKKGADPNVLEKQWHQTPLVFAADKDRGEAIRTLVKLGAKTGLKTYMQDVQEEAAREQAAERRRNEVLISFEPEKHQDMLFTKPWTGGADVPVGSMASAAPINMTGLGFYQLTQENVPAAIVGGPAGAGRVRRGPQPKGPFTAEQIQFAIAEGRKVQESSAAANGPVTEVVDTLNGGVAGFAASVGGVGGMTALHHAVRQGSLSAVKALLESGAPVNEPNAVDNTTPLLLAAINGQYDVAMELLKHGADPNIAANSGLAPLYATINTMYSPKSRFPQPQAVQNQKTTHLELMEALLKAGAKPNQRLATQFWYFAYNNCGNANCGLENITGTTPFWRAAYALDVDAMKLLVKYGADPNIPSTPPAGGRGGRGGARAGAPGAQPAGAGVDPLIPFDPNGGAPPAAGGAAGGRGGFAGAASPFPPLDPETDSASKAVPPGIGVYPIHAVAGVGYGNGFAGNSHRHAPDAWMAAMKYVVEELHADVNQRDNGGYTPLHHAAARGDNEMIMYLVSKGADVKAVARNGRTTVDMANGPVQRLSPIPETIALLEKLGAKNSHRCVSCF
jgi:ankyrin repeat protein